MFGRSCVLLVGAVLAFPSASALAQDADRGLYVGLSAGQSSVKFDDNFVTVAGATASSVSKDESDTGYKIYVGYQLHRNFALEGGWADLGSFRATRNVTAPATGSLTANVEASGFYLDAIGILPLANRFSLFGKLGAMYATTEASFSTTGAVALGSGVSRNPEESEVEFKLGVGASYSFTKNLALRAEWEHFADVGDKNSTGEGDIDLISIGITFRF